MDPPSVEIRVERALPVAAERAYAMVTEYYQAQRVVARETLEDFRKEYFAPAAGVWLASVARNLAGCIALREMSQGQAAEIKRMYVREAYRGLGIAQRLLAEAESFARGAGYRRIF